MQQPPCHHATCRLPHPSTLTHAPALSPSPEQEILADHESHFSQVPVESYEEIREECKSIRDTTVRRAFRSRASYQSYPHMSNDRRHAPSQPQN